MRWDTPPRVGQLIQQPPSPSSRSNRCRLWNASRRRRRVAPHDTVSFHGDQLAEYGLKTFDEAADASPFMSPFDDACNDCSAKLHWQQIFGTVNVRTHIGINSRWQPRC